MEKGTKRFRNSSGTYELVDGRIEVGDLIYQYHLNECYGNMVVTRVTETMACVYVRPKHTVRFFRIAQDGITYRTPKGAYGRTTFYVYRKVNNANSM